LQVDVELEALWTSAARVQDLVLDNVYGVSSLVASLSTVVELLEGRIGTVAANGVHWWTWYALVAALSHFSELKSELEMPEFRCNADLTEDLRQIPPKPGCAWPQTRWHRTFLPRSHTAHLTMRGSSGGGLCG
jgi:hypothetical protein